MAQSYISVAFILLITLSSLDCEPVGTEKFNDLWETLLMRYHKYARPEEGRGPTNVQYGVSVQQVISYDIYTDLAVLDIYEYIIWNDTRLQWNRSKLDLENIRFPKQLLWVPDVKCYNCWHEKNDDDRLVIVTSDGSAFWGPRRYLSIPCTIEKDSVASCSFSVGSMTYDATQLNLTGLLDTFEMEMHRPSPRYEMFVDKEPVVTQKIKQYGSHHYGDLQFNFKIRAKRLRNTGNF